MTTLPFLPLKNGALFIDNSVMDEWNECPEQFKNRFLLNRVGAFEKPALNFGSGIHIALAAIERGLPLDQALLVMACHFEHNPQPETDHRSAGHAEETIRRYVKNHEVDKWEVLQTDKGPFVEFPFAYRLFDYDWPLNGAIAHGYTPIFFCGKIDLAIRRPMDGSKWVVDHKTTFQLGKMLTYEMKATPQMKGYCWAFKRAFGELPAGYIVDAIRSSVPTQKLMDEVRFSEDTSKLDKWWGEQFYREAFYVDQGQIDEWERNTIALVEEMLWHYSRGYFPLRRKWCCNKYGRCQYYDVCDLPVAQRPLALSSNLFIDDTWTPLNPVALEEKK